MCGVVAIVGPSSSVRREDVERATRALRHRGPDGEGVWVAPDGRAGLGHTRLAIIDPDATQPIANESGRQRIVVNGEFYGYEAVQEELARRGHRLRTRTDSEIALHLYEEMGSVCLQRLRGHFALALWDASTETLFAARDRFGMKPLFYAQRGDRLVLASEVKALRALGLVDGWDRSGVWRALHACPDEAGTLFAGIHALPPGHYLVARRGRIRIERYWDVPAHDRRAPLPRSEQDDVRDRVRRLVEESVRLRMKADVPVGCLLSGGLDSSAVLGIAATCAERPVTAFTVGFGPPEYDESTAAATVAQHAGARHVVVRVSAGELADHFEATVHASEILQYNAHASARYLLTRGVRDAGYKSVLAGEGGDEAFLGYGFLRAAARATADDDGSSGVRSALAALRRLRLAARWLLAGWRGGKSARGESAGGLERASPWLARLARTLDLSPALLTRLRGGLDHLHAVLDPGFLADFEGRDVYHDIYRACDDEVGLAGRETPRQILYLWLHSLFPSYHLAADRLDMAHAVEVRLPFLDHRLFEALQRMPVSALVTPGREKALLRDAVRDHLPEQALQREKQPFWAPPSAAAGPGPLRDLVEDTLRSRALDDVPFVDRRGVTRLLDRLPALGADEVAGVDSLLLMLTSLVVLGERAVG